MMESIGFLIFAIEVDITADNTTDEVVGLDLGIEKNNYDFFRGSLFKH